ncbi:DEAD/DEAH box helicase [Persicirhabdus sediminis]|uniref:ATP-binding protein n=1 Tax=Persicirhabdus sediminis TaxID=454144 RepID=A0A8J7MAX5_9BACT|nr:DEAD/DEAH box helicase [Persicirhabdus sediminis]MBK1790164.1 ATP-binding protein [Persicirhabdus sediminis]
MTQQQIKATQILKAWHRVEFFQTYSLPEDSTQDNSSTKISTEEFFKYGNSILPWLNAKLLKKDKSCSTKTVYTLHLGLFDTAVISDVIKQHTASITSGSISATELEQRLEINGLSCFAKLEIDEFGTPQPESLSVSSLPWAIGMLINGQLDEMSFGTLSEDSQNLKESIYQIFSILPACSHDSKIQCLDSHAINQICVTLYKWAGLTQSQIANSGSAPKYIFQIHSREIRIPAKKDETSEDETSEDENASNQLPILNSFYIRDLEIAIKTISSGTAGKGLLRYLGLPAAHDIDLYSQEALPKIAEQLHPSLTPEGRWPSPPVHNMSLMQQFAVNTAFEDLKEEGILSVNGPPGTGKTTLLRDIIAQNLVGRAKELSRLDNAQAGLNKDGSLIDALTGFEMVVASSNNAAVENISKELPQNKSIDENYADCSYLQPVANQIAAKKDKSKKLQPINNIPEQSWGMISAILGAKRNRSTFTSRLFFENHWGRNPPEARNKPNDFLNFWQFRKLYKGPTFKEAKDNFNARIKDFKQANAQIQEFEALLKSCDPKKYQNIKNEISEKIDLAKSAEENLHYKLGELKFTQANLELKLSIEETSLEKARLDQPNVIARILNFKSNKIYTKNLKTILEAIEKIKRELSETNRIIHTRHTSLKSLQIEQLGFSDELDNIITEHETKLAKLSKQSIQFEALSKPDYTQSIGDADVQRNAFWQGEQINNIRSKVFIAAMQLHEAWLIEASDDNAFRAQIYGIPNLLQGKKTASSVSSWQTLFMMVPVVSTTFAAMGSMFSDVPINTLGWLMIDEAGQAVPQAAIGGIMRSKRTIVVGDPLQIEPVFTSPPDLVNYLMSSKLGKEGGHWSPSSVSVQQLADRINPHGGKLNETWLGVPLRVHRRCIEPMFSISNQIAYSNRMIHGSPNEDAIKQKKHTALGPNNWINSNGKCTFKQFTDSLAGDVLDLLIKATSKGVSLNSFYIITPFKAVKAELIAKLKQDDSLLQIGFGGRRAALNNFLNKNIGTVHTFQGKENDTVILVLGCDDSSIGGANWAASKPNLLNVAVTRAKKHLFVVGNSEIWSKMKHFNQLHQKVHSLNANETSIV